MSSKSRTTSDIESARGLAMRCSALRLFGWATTHAVLASAIAKTMEAYAGPENVSLVFGLSLVTTVGAMLLPIVLTQWIVTARTTKKREGKTPAFDIFDYTTRFEQKTQQKLPDIVAKTASPAQSIWLCVLHRRWRFLSSRHHVFIPNVLEPKRTHMAHHELAHVQNRDTVVRALAPVPGTLAAIAASSSIAASFIVGQVSASSNYNLTRGFSWTDAAIGLGLSGCAYLATRLAHFWEERSADAISSSIVGRHYDSRTTQDGCTYFRRARELASAVLGLPGASTVSLCIAGAAAHYAVEIGAWTRLAYIRSKTIGMPVDVYTLQTLLAGRPFEYRSVSIDIAFGIPIAHALQELFAAMSSIPLVIWFAVTSMVGSRRIHFTTIGMALLTLLMSILYASSAADYTPDQLQIARWVLNQSVACIAMLLVARALNAGSGILSVGFGIALALSSQVLALVINWSILFHGHAHGSGLFWAACALLAALFLRFGSRRAWHVSLAIVASLFIQVWTVKYRHALAYAPVDCQTFSTRRAQAARERAKESNDKYVAMDPVELFSTYPVLSCPSLPRRIVETVKEALRRGDPFVPRMGAYVAELIAYRTDPYVPLELRSLGRAHLILQAAKTSTWLGMSVPPAFRSEAVDSMRAMLSGCHERPPVECSAVARLINNEQQMYRGRRGQKAWFDSLNTLARNLAIKPRDCDCPNQSAFADEIDHCHGDEPTHAGPRGLCTRFTQTIELRTAIREAWGLPASCGECSPYDATTSGLCGDKKVIACERVLACEVNASWRFGKHCGDLNVCRDVVEPAVAQHALVAIGLRRKWWRHPEYKSLRSLAEVNVPEADDQRRDDFVVRNAMQNWSPKFKASKDYLSRLAQSARRGFSPHVGFAEASLLASTKCSDARDATEFVGFIKALDMFGPMCQCDSILSRNEEYIRRQAAHLLQGWQQAGVCASGAGKLTLPIGDPQDVCDALTKWARSEVFAQFETFREYHRELPDPSK